MGPMLTDVTARAQLSVGLGDKFLIRPRNRPAARRVRQQTGRIFRPIPTHPKGEPHAIHL